MTTGGTVTVALGMAIAGMLALTMLPARQDPARRPIETRLSTEDYIEIQQLVRKTAWAMDSGDDYGYAFADLFTPDGVLTGITHEGPSSASATGRDGLAAVARAGRGANHQSLYTMNHVVRPKGDGAAGRVYVVVVDVGVVGRPNAVRHGGFFDDEYSRTELGWRLRARTYHRSQVDTWPAGTGQ
jgi:hypothetical protein